MHSQQVRVCLKIPSDLATYEYVYVNSSSLDELQWQVGEVAARRLPSNCAKWDVKVERDQNGACVTYLVASDEDVMLLTAQDLLVLHLGPPATAMRPLREAPLKVRSYDNFT